MERLDAGRYVRLSDTNDLRRLTVLDSLIYHYLGASKIVSREQKKRASG